MTEPDETPAFKPWSPDPVLLRDRLVSRFAAQGKLYGEFAADVIAWRGVTHRTRAELADEIGVAEAEIAAAEAGELDPADADPALRWGARRHTASLRRRRR